MRAGLATGVMTVLMLAGCGNAQQNPKAAPDSYPAAYEAGRREAEAELAQGNAHWLRVPEAGAWQEQSGIDDATGLPWEPADPADPATRGRVAGHNAALQAYIERYGIPEGARRELGPDLASLRNFIVTETASKPPIELRVNGPAAFTPDGKFGIAWRQVLPEAPRHTAILWLRAADEGRPVQMQPLPPIPVARHGGRIELAWGPPGADVAILRWVTPSGATPADREGYSAIDLRSGHWLRHESGAIPATSQSTRPATRK
jgi:hypothetical protein